MAIIVIIVSSFVVINIVICTFVHYCLCLSLCLSNFLPS